MASPGGQGGALSTRERGAGAAKRMKWALELSSGNPRSRSDRQGGQGDVVYPIGYSEKPVPDTSIQETDKNLVEKRCWDVALGPLKQIPMNLFIMYMSGNTISIFPIMMVCMMAWRPIQALMSMSATFKLLESSSQQWLQGLVYLIGNLLASALAIYKCQSMGLLPTHSSDWLAFIDPPQRLEIMGGGMVLWTNYPDPLSTFINCTYYFLKRSKHLPSFLTWNHSLLFFFPPTFTSLQTVFYTEYFINGQKWHL